MPLYIMDDDSAARWKRIVADGQKRLDTLGNFFLESDVELSGTSRKTIGDILRRRKVRKHWDLLLKSQTPAFLVHLGERKWQVCLVVCRPEEFVQVSRLPDGTLVVNSVHFAL
jgi:hypothetical protein